MAKWVLLLLLWNTFVFAQQGEIPGLKDDPETLGVGRLETEEDLNALGTTQDQNYLVPLGSLFVVFVVLPGIYLWRCEVSPPTPQEKKSKNMINLNYGHIRHIGWMGPVLSIVACVVYGLLFHFDNVTRTHCPGPNPLPSISAAVGNNIPERWFFRIGILLHTGQRLVDGVITYNWYKLRLPTSHWFSWLTQMITLLHYLEVFSLICIAMISSQEYYPAHEKSFMCWAVLQQARMVITMYLYKNVLTHPWPGPWEQRGWKLRWISWLVNTLALFASGFVFVLHNLYCTPYMYAMYGALEYTVVASNVAFSCAVACDWPEGQRFIIKGVGRRSENDI